jgi:hypothetical protein
MSDMTDFDRRHKFSDFVKRHQGRGKDETQSGSSRCGSGDRNASSDSGSGCQSGSSSEVPLR